MQTPDSTPVGSIIIIITTIIIKSNTCTTLLTVAHEGTMTVNACASPKQKN